MANTEILFAGEIQVQYENGFLRYISYQDHEIIRRIYFALRDEHWTTLEPFIENEKIESSADQFIIRYECYHQKNNENIFRWFVLIEGKEDGSISFELSGEALQDTKRNRAGLCILHPIKENTGRQAEIFHPDGTVGQKEFPILVSPDNPFKNIKRLRWENDGLWYELTMEGDIFETEDQRNWSDASFKTFCTPSHLPKPVELKTGDKVWQKVIFKPAFKPQQTKSAQKPPSIQLFDNGKALRLPRVGVAASTEFNSLSAGAVEKIRSLRLDHYRIEVTPSHKTWVSDFSRDSQNAFDLDLPLEVALHLSANYENEMDAFIQLSLQNRVKIKNLLLLSEDKPVTAVEVIDLIGELKKHLPDVSWGAGTDFNFMDLNANRFNSLPLDFVSYSIIPQQHAFDDATLIENLEGQTDTARTAKDIYPTTAVHVSSITLRERFNPYSSNQNDKFRHNEEKADPRQLTDFGALWTFGSLRALTAAGVDSVTYYQTVGKQGILSEAGDPYPLFETFRNILPYQDARAFSLKSSHPLLADGLLLSKQERMELWIANYSNAVQLVVYNKLEIELKPRELKSVQVTNMPINEF